jgi:hypothetical protein
MNYSPELGSIHSLIHMLESMRKGQLEITSDGSPVRVDKKVGSGGTKNVYRAVIGDEPFALGLPNTVDGVEIMRQKWSVALSEPANTARIRELGLLTNPVCEILPVSINGVPFPAIRMALYQDLPYRIMDGKNPSESTVTTDVLPEQLDEDSFQEYFTRVASDVRQMIEKGVRVKTDSLNLCILDGSPRIFLSDLGGAEFEPIPDDIKAQVAERYIGSAFSTFLNGLTESEYQRSKDSFGGPLFKYDNPDNIQHRLVSQAFVAEK